MAGNEHVVGSARDAGTAGDSAFRRRWTWRTRLRVVLLGRLLGIVLALLYRTLRVRWAAADDVLGRHARGERFVFACWHEHLVLLPIVLRRVPEPFRPRVLLSWHRDAEIGAQAARRFGVGAIRGSSTRGGVGALRGLLAAHRAGEDVVLIPDGPRGPRRSAKPGLVLVARSVDAPVVPVSFAAAPHRRLRSWDRMAIPLPFARVAIRFGAPVAVARDATDSLARVQTAMEQARREAGLMLGVEEEG